MSTPGRLAYLFWILAFLLAVNVGILAINRALMPYGSGGGMFLGWLLCMILVVVCCGAVSKKLGGEHLLFAAVILYAIFDVCFGVMGGRIYALVSLKESPVLPISEADQPAHARCDVFHFSDGRIARSYHAWEEFRGRHGRFYYHVAPILSADWKETDPVTAWAAWEGSSEFPPATWQKDLRGGYRAELTPNFVELAQRIVARRHLVVRGGAPILIWAEHPREALLDIAKIELGYLLAADAIALLVLILPLLPRKRAA